MTEIPPTNRNTPSEEVKRNKAKTLEMGVPTILSKKMPLLKELGNIYKDSKYVTSHQISKETQDSSLQKVTSHYNKMFKK